MKQAYGEKAKENELCGSDIFPFNLEDGGSMCLLPTYRRKFM
jgi:hypothetical protein